MTTPTPFDPAPTLLPRPMVTRYPETPSQTGGPYVHIGLAPEQAGFDIFDHNFGNVLVTDETEGERIVLEGRVIDGTGTPVRDALLESWQADAHGRYAHPEDSDSGDRDTSFRGWGRTGGDFDTGVFTLETIKPGAVTNPDGSVSAPHILLVIFARGINIGLHTRVYFADETEPNDRDPVLSGIEWEVRRNTLIAARSERDGRTVYTIDIRLQDTPDGGAETVFFDI